MAKDQKNVHLGIELPKPIGSIGGRKFLQAAYQILSGFANLEIKTPNGPAKINLSPKKALIQLPGNLSNALAGAQNFRGEWLQPSATDAGYAFGDTVLIRGGVGAGYYFSMADANKDAPYNSAKWAQLANNNAMGRWA